MLGPEPQVITSGDEPGRNPKKQEPVVDRRRLLVNLETRKQSCCLQVVHVTSFFELLNKLHIMPLLRAILKTPFCT